MKVLLVGGGGREHAIAWKLSQSPRVTELLCAPGNAGIAGIARVFPEVKATDIDAQVALAQSEKVDFVVVAPDDPLALGLVDRLEEAGIPAFGPTAAAARIEYSKVYSKGLMKKYGIPTAAYETFTDPDAAKAYILEQGAPIVVKADGLALGKGVVVASTVEEAIDAVDAILRDRQFGASGASIVVEACMTGPEVTQLAFCDGERLALMPPSQDHKRALDDDQGPNTGGMGAISPVPVYTRELQEQAMREIFLPTVDMLRNEGIPFRGVIYFGLMLTPNGPSVIEYNARFGDPETQVVLPLLDSDIMDVFIACREGRLEPSSVKWKEQACAAVVLASGGYPTSYKTGFPISGLEDCPALVFHAGTRLEDGQAVTAGGRVLAVSAVADTLAEALAGAYAEAQRISFEGMYYRKDIGRGAATGGALPHTPQGA